MSLCLMQYVKADGYKSHLSYFVRVLIHSDVDKIVYFDVFLVHTLKFGAGIASLV